MSEQIHEFMFPRSYLVDYVQERPPYNGKITKIPNGDLGYKTIANDSITQRMFLITANTHRLEFSFSKNPWEWETGCNFGDDFTQLISFKFNDIESVSNSNGSIPISETLSLSIELDQKYPYFEHIRVQCVLSLQNNPSNVKHICYLEVKARNSTATLGGTLLPLKDGVWSIGEELDPSKTVIGNTKVHVFPLEKVEGPLVFTGVGIDNYAGFVFQIGRLHSNSILLTFCDLIDECFMKNDIPRLIPADITNYEYFESLKRDHTGYPTERQSLSIRKQKFCVRNSFRELAVEDANIPILFQQLNYAYSSVATDSLSRVLPSMVDLLQESFAENRLGLLQSVIRINHLKADDDSSINPRVKQIWATFADTMLMIKQFKLERPNLNMIECAILSESVWDKQRAVIVAVAQCLMAFVLVLHVLIPQAEAYSILTNTIDKEYSSAWYRFWMNSFWRVDFSFMMTIIAVTMVILKVAKQIEDQRKFHTVFINKLTTSKKLNLIDRLLLILDNTVNNMLPVLLVFLTFMLISRSDEVTDLVLNCVALTFIVELDDDLNERDTAEIDDLVIKTFKTLLLENCQQLDREHNGSSSSPWDKDFLARRLIGADYSTNSKSSKDNVLVKNKVLEFIRDGKQLPVVNANFGDDPHYGKRKYLVLRFKKKKVLVINVQENLVVDFSIIERLLKSTRDNRDNFLHEASLISWSFLDSPLWTEVTYKPFS